MRARPAINEKFHRGIGRLLTRAQTSPEYGKPYLRVAIGNIIHGWHYNHILEDKFDHMCRALDSLLNHYGLTSQYLMAGLDQNEKDQVKAELRSVFDNINAMAARLSSAGKLDKARALTQIAKRVKENAANKDNSFGASVTELLKKFNFPDADIIDSYYQANPRPDQIPTWGAAVSYYRTRAIHQGFFDVLGTQYDLTTDVLRYANHLHDILVRIALRLLDYDGTYQPVVEATDMTEPLDWVTPETDAWRLGYR